MQNSLKRNCMLRQHLLFAYWLSKHPVSWFTTLYLTQSVTPPLATYTSLCSACVTYRTSCHAGSHRHFPPTLYRECYGFEKALFTLRRFLPYTPSCCFQDLPGALSSPSRVAGLHAGHRNIALVRLLCWMTAIHKRVMLVGSIYLSKTSFEVTAPEPWNLPLTGFEPAFLKVPWITSRFYWRLGNRVLWVLINK